MKIVHITSHIGSGGDWTIINSLLKIFQSNRHQVFVCGCRANSTQFNYLEMPLNQGIKGFIESLLKIGKIPSDVDIVHVHSPISLLLAIAYKYLCCSSVKVIFTYHWKTSNYGFKKKLKTLLFKFPNIIHSCSTDIHKYIQHEFQVNYKKNELAYVGASPCRFYLSSTSKKKELRQKYGISADAFTLLFVGRLSPEKNISLIFSYLAHNPKKDIILVIAGDGDLRNELEQIVTRLNIKDRISFFGQVEKIEEVYTLADLLILPSSSMETFGMVVIEAAFCGVPTLRSDLPGAKDQITHGEDGFVFPAEQPERMFDLLDKVYSQRSCLPKIGNRARKRALENFTAEKMYVRFLNLYQKALDGGTVLSEENFE